MAHSKSLAQGFTALEVILAVSLLTVVFAFSAVSLGRFQHSAATRASDREITNALVVAARHARAGTNDTAWGVYIPYDETTRTTASLVVFSGNSYATRNPAYDLTISVNTSIRFTSVDFSGAGPDVTNSHEIVFARYTGSTNNYGSLTVDWYGGGQTIVIPEGGLPIRQ